VYCKDGRRRLDAEHVAFTFLGFTFRARAARARSGAYFTGYLPAVSKQALITMRSTLRRWRLHRHITLKLTDLARLLGTHHCPAACAVLPLEVGDRELVTKTTRAV